LISFNFCEGSEKLAVQKNGLKKFADKRMAIAQNPIRL
jgi:hypothetical protein